MLFYLAGSIEYSPDLGKAWRAEITPFLKLLGHEVYDPASDEMKNLNETEVREFRSWKKSDLPRFQETIRKIIAYDLSLIERSVDAIICYWDQHAGRGAGTQGELTFAHRMGIPVYLICAVPVEHISGWLLGCATEVFTCFDDLREFVAGKLAEKTATASKLELSVNKRIAMNAMRGNLGWIEVICGPMFSGKSEELIRRLRRAEIARQRVQIFKPILDERYSSSHIVSHNDMRIRSEAVNSAAEIQAKVDLRTEVIGIDEAQFLGDAMVELVVRLADMGKRIVIAGLDTDYLGRPFHPMPELLAVADEITKTLAICMQCGNPAKHTQRLIASEDLIVVGAAGMYEARCRRCFEPNLALAETKKKSELVVATAVR